MMEYFFFYGVVNVLDFLKIKDFVSQFFLRKRLKFEFVEIVELYEYYDSDKENEFFNFFKKIYFSRVKLKILGVYQFRGYFFFFSVSNVFFVISYMFFYFSYKFLVGLDFSFVGLDLLCRLKVFEVYQNIVVDD